MTYQFTREHLRAPLYRAALYEDDGSVLRAKTKNISEGGILLGELGHVPAINLIPLMFELPVYPDLQKTNISAADVNSLMDFDVEIVRLRAKIVRSFEGTSEVDQVFVSNIGCEFVLLSDENKKKISDYVSRYARNIVYFLGLFESKKGSSRNSEQIRAVAKVLGYDYKAPIAVLRQKVLHDYQSLEGL